MASYEAKTFKGTMIYLKLSLHAKKSKFLEINCSHYQATVLNTIDSGYKGMLNRGNSGYRGQFAADQNFYLIKTGWIEEKQSFLVDLKTSK